MTRAISRTSDQLTINSSESAVALALTRKFAISALIAIVVTKRNVTSITSPSFEAWLCTSVANEARETLASSKIADAMLTTSLAGGDIDLQKLTRQILAVVSTKREEHIVIDDHRVTPSFSSRGAGDGRGVPLLSHSIENEQAVRFSDTTIVTTKHNDLVSICGSLMHGSRSRGDSACLNLLPLEVHKVKFVNIIKVLVVVRTSSEQVQIVSDVSKRVAGSWGGSEGPSYRNINPCVAGQAEGVEVLIENLRVRLILGDTSP